MLSLIIYGIDPELAQANLTELEHKIRLGVAAVPGTHLVGDNVSIALIPTPPPQRGHSLVAIAEDILEPADVRSDLAYAIRHELLDWLLFTANISGVQANVEAYVTGVGSARETRCA